MSLKPSFQNIDGVVEELIGDYQWWQEAEGVVVDTRVQDQHAVLVAVCDQLVGDVLVWLLGACLDELNGDHGTAAADVAHPGGIGGTFGGNPVSAAAAVAVLKQIEAGGVLESAQRIEATLMPRLLELKAKYQLSATSAAAAP